MKKSLVICFILFLTVMMIPIKGQSQEFVSAKIRVGLFHNSSARASYRLYSDKGFRLGLKMKEEQLFTVMDFSDRFLDVSSADSKDFISINKNFKDKKDALKHVEQLSNKGTDSYLFFDGSWSVWAKTSDNAIYSKDCNIIVIGESSELPKIILPYTDGSIFFTSMDSEGLVSIEGRRYRGILEMMPASDGNIQVVNELGLEEYLYGVLPKEVPLGWPEEVLKAQAVAARTYTVANLSKWQKYGFDIDSNSSDQIYQGFDVENANTNRAVDETRGEVLYFEGKPIIAFYHSDSGGQTENCQDVFGSDLPYLQSVDDLFYANSPNSKWEVQLSLNDISKKVNLSTPGLGEVYEISIIERSPTGRVKKILLKGNLGENIIENNEIRNFFGIKSNFFDIFGGSNIHLAVVSTDEITRNIELQNQCIMAQGGLTSFPRKTVSILGADISKNLCYDTFSDTYIIQGRGYGHGVGMSQWGAKAMAENGYNYKKILLHYYKNVEIR